MLRRNGHTHTHENTKAVLNRLSRAIGHLESVKKMVEDDRFVAAPKWLEKAKNAPLEGKVVAMPARDDIDFEVAVNLIVELYSK